MGTTFAFTLPLAGAEKPFTGELWAAARPVYARILEHPFLKGLADGSLPRSRFEFYLLQDGQYLRAFSQARERIAAGDPRAAVPLLTRATELDPDIKVMFITGFAAVALNPDSEAPKDAKILSKPFHLKDLVHEVEKLLEAA